MKPKALRPSAPPPANALLDYGVAASARAGETACGDLHLVRAVGAGALVAVVDGLGHGEEAAFAARVAVQTLARHAGEPLPEMVRRCHEALRGTRGVVVSLAYFETARDTLSWVGLGNVRGVLITANHEADGSPVTRLVTRSGIVGAGAALPPVRPWVIPLQPQDTLVLATDGLQSEFEDDLPSLTSSQHTADRLLERYGKRTDDALVLVARYLGKR